MGLYLTTLVSYFVPPGNDPPLSSPVGQEVSRVYRKEEGEGSKESTGSRESAGSLQHSPKVW